ncbi:MAG: ATPase [Clostridiales bacterium]|nr:ATPase [Clostridiales bacterium]
MSKCLGIELGSTRIKTVLIDEKAKVVAQGNFEWENTLVDGLWSYSLEEVEKGLQTSYKNMLIDYGKPIEQLDCIGISAMMHGYLAFDSNNKLLVPFRTWRNTNTHKAAKELSYLFNFNIPMRWSVAHFYQAVLNDEPHVKDVAFITTLAGYVHYRLTGNKVIGIGDASGMFPISNGAYDQDMLDKFDGLLRAHGRHCKFKNMLPKIMLAGDNAGSLTSEGARFLDVSGALKAGAMLCPPEGDAGTGMVATNSVLPRTANVSAGTSAFLMAVMERPLARHYDEIDVVTTPTGEPVAMVHVNNFTNEINAWASVFAEAIALVGAKCDKSELFEKLFACSLNSDEDTGKLVGYNFLSGEPIVNVDNGRPLFARMPDSKFTLSNFMQMQIYSALGALAMGLEILRSENVAVDNVCGHGGFFKTEFVGQNAMSAAVGAPVTVLSNAGEGGAWGMAILALYALNKKTSLSEFLQKLFANTAKVTVEATAQKKQKFSNFMKLYKQGLSIAQKASEVL